MPKLLGLLGPIWNDVDGIILPEVLGESENPHSSVLSMSPIDGVFSKKTAASIFTIPCALPRTLPPLPPHQEIESISSPLDLGRAFLIGTKNQIWQK